MRVARSALVLCLTGFSSPTLFGQSIGPCAEILPEDDTAVMTCAMPNGHAWLGFSPGERHAYLMGFKAGMAEEAVGRAKPNTFSVTVMQQRIDRFYSDKENILIPIELAFSWLQWHEPDPSNTYSYELYWNRLKEMRDMAKEDKLEDTLRKAGSPQKH